MEVRFLLSITENKKRVSLYIDGFNLYHSIADENDGRLKWLNFRSLAVSMLRPGECLSDIYFFTAVLRWELEKQQRHRNFIAAQEALGVTVVESNFKKVMKKCTVMDRRCPRYEENKRM